MINFECANKYCRGDISIIENYEQAVNDKIQTWDCHHRLEELGLSMEELKDCNLYYDRPASELIFLAHAEHIRLHQAERMKDPNKRKTCGLSGEKNPMYGRRGKDCPIHKKRWMKRENEKPIYVDIDLIEHYLSLGYHRGRK